MFALSIIALHAEEILICAIFLMNLLLIVYVIIDYMKSLYRRYRPTRLEDVVGQEQVTEPLANSLKEGKIGHAYLFIGPRGTGKTSVARIFAHEVNGFPYTIEDDYVDIIEIDGASNRGIDNIRELREKVAIAPTAGKYKIYIIDEVHMLTKEAFNALLKTLEEPPAHVIFIMATTDAVKVPVTITSRSQTYTFRLAEPGVILPYIKSICEKEKISIDDDALSLVVKRGGGSFRDTLSLLDQISTLSDAKISKEMVVGALGLPEDEQIMKLLSSYRNGDMDAIVTNLKELLTFGIKPETLAEELISTIVAEPSAELLPLLTKLPDVKAPFAEAKLLVSLVDVVGASRRIIDTESKTVNDSSNRTTTNHKIEGAEHKVVEANYKVVEANHKVDKDEHKIGENEDVDRKVKDTTIKIQSKETSGAFDWNGFIEKVKAASGALGLQVASTNFEVDETTLNIYPNKDFVKNNLSRDKNIKVLSECAGGLKIKICNVNEDPKIKNDELISKMSDIMGGEVVNDGGGNPFK